MTDKLHATIDHIDDLGKRFHGEAIHLDQFKHLVSHPAPNVADAALSSALTRLIDAFGIAHETVTGLLDSRGGAEGTDEHALATYKTGRDKALKRADTARKLATEHLDAVSRQIIPGGSAQGLSKADGLTLAEVLRGVYTVPAALSEAHRKKLALLEKEVKDLKNNPTSATPGSAEWDEHFQARRAARAAVIEQRLKVASVEGWMSKFKGSRGARLTLGEIAHESRGWKMGAYGALGPLSGALTAGMVYYQMQEDHEKGWSWRESLVKDGGPAVAGLAAGVVVEGLVPVGAPAATVAAGVVVAVGVGYGVGTYGYELTHNAHFSDHIHKDGVIVGIGEGFADASKAWWKNDVKGMRDKAENTAKKVWHGIFG